MSGMTDPLATERQAYYKQGESDGWHAALDALLDRADEGIEFGPDNFTRLVRMVRQVRAALPAKDTQEVEARIAGHLDWTGHSLTGPCREETP